MQAVRVKGAKAAWKDNATRKPLIIKGVRQCGKTYILKEFGKQHYSDTAYLNFEENESLKTVFEKDFDVKRILFELGLYIGKSIKAAETLIIFDEIQRPILYLFTEKNMLLRTRSKPL